MYKKILSTNSGMWGIWDYETYKHIDEYDKWDKLFCEDEDIIKQIKNKTFIPAYIFQDGSCSFTVKIDEELNEREEKYVCVKSEPYLLKTSGKVVVSGIEHIDKKLNDTNTIIINLPSGEYSVKIFLLSWDEEPGAYLENGEVNPNALSDFVIIIQSNANSDIQYREKINTFSEDDTND